MDKTSNKFAVHELREMIAHASSKSKEGHIPSALSILDILWVMYDRIMKFDADNPNDPSRDRFILSKGHGSLGLYAVLIAKGLIPKETLDDFGAFDSILGGHPDRNKIPWVEASTGSLGHGLPIAIGLALGNKIQKYPGRIFTIVGDGECNEGTIWESALLAAHHNLDNLCCVVDYNHSTDRALQVGNLIDKFRSFGWNAIGLSGHDHDELFRLMNNIPAKSGMPTVLIAETIKGYGISSMENQPSWHHKSPSADEIELIIKEIYDNA
ncbi:MAG: transketolase [Phormidesmis sp. FL-bin-119]|nr:transketolase [Pedobacter sp.]